jgi:hypothetical protein
MPPIVKSENCERGPQVHAWSGDIWVPVPDIKEEAFDLETRVDLTVRFKI